MIPFSCAVETLRTANRLSEGCLFEWQFFSSNGAFVVSNIGISIPTQPLAEAKDLETLIICASEDAQHFDDITTINLLRKMDKQGVNLGTVSWGSFILAKAGLLKNRVSTTFPSDIDAMRARFSSLDIRKDVVFVHGGKHIKSSGVAKSLEATLYLCEFLYGKEIAQRLAGGLGIRRSASSYY